MPPLKLKPKLKQYTSATPPTKGFRQGRFLVPGVKTLKLKLKLKLPYQGKLPGARLQNTETKTETETGI